MNTYQITPTTGEKPYTLQAARYEFDSTSGRHLFYAGTGDDAELVANLLNVSVSKQPAQPAE
jgi:hypothetical protein